MTSELLTDLIVHELWSIPADKWGFFFPAHVALWRFIRSTRPDVLGELSAEFADGPVFHGRGAEWFCGRLLEDDAVLGAQPTPEQLQAGRERHIEPTPLQRQHVDLARRDVTLHASQNQGRPPIAATTDPTSSA